MEQRNGKAYLISGLTLPGSPEPRNPPEMMKNQRSEKTFGSEIGGGFW